MSNEDLYYRRLNQRTGLGILGGLLGAVVGAAIWAAVTVITDYQIGWMAIGVGFLVGKSVCFFGKGVDSHLRIIGALLSLFGCLLGNLLTTLFFLSNFEGVPFLEVLEVINIEVVVFIFKETFVPIDLLFYTLAIFEGYKVSVKTVSSKNVEESTELSENQA